MLAEIMVCITFYICYWVLCFLATGTDKKNLAGLRSYPDGVQRAVRESPALGKNAPREKSVPSILLENLTLFTVVFSALGMTLKDVLSLNDFGRAFYFFLALGEGLGLFDLVVIDLLWWRNTKRVRFSFLPEKELYQNPKKHVDSFLRGIPLFGATAALAAGLVTTIG